MDFVAFGFQAADEIENVDRSVPESYFQLMPAHAEPLNVDTLKLEFKRWILTCAFRNCIEGMQRFLDAVHEICAIWSVDDGTQFTSEEWEKWKEKYAKQSKKFHWAGLPDKIDELTKAFPDLKIPEMTSELSSMNKSRNCFAHRGGIVTAMDSNSDDGLSVSWVKPGIRVTGQDGTRIITIPPPPNVAKGEICDLRSYVQVPTAKLFKLGDTLAFSTQEFCDIGFTLLEFGRQLIANLEAYAKVKGITADENC